MNRGPENVFGKARGRYDEVMARRLAASLPEQALAACAAMADCDFRRFVAMFNETFGNAYGRNARILSETSSPPIGPRVPAAPEQEATR